MSDNLTINYEVFEEGGVKVLTVSRGNEALRMFRDDDAEAVHNFLTHVVSNSDKFVAIVEFWKGCREGYKRKDWRERSEGLV